MGIKRLSEELITASPSDDRSEGDVNKEARKWSPSQHSDDGASPALACITGARDTSDRLCIDRDTCCCTCALLQFAVPIILICLTCLNAFCRPFMYVRWRDLPRTRSKIERRKQVIAVLKCWSRTLCSAYVLSSIIHCKDVTLSRCFTAGTC